MPVALEYGIQGIESSELSAPDVPAQLYAQARLAARNGVKLNTVLDRYISGYHLLQGFVDDIADTEELSGSAALREVRRISVFVFKRLTAAVSEQYEDESRKQASSPESRKASLVRRLLAGERVDTSQLDYNLDVFHVGLIASGTGVETGIRGLAQALDCACLIIEVTDATTWAWLGRRTPPDINRIKQLVAGRWPSDAPLALGEVGSQLAGWRWTHRQALAAVPVVGRTSNSIIHYHDVALLASALQDDLLVNYLRTHMLEPLDKGRHCGQELRDTIRAYLATERNVSSTAAQLGINRRTVTNRLRAVERSLGSPLSAIGADVELALRLETLNAGVHKVS